MSERNNHINDGDEPDGGQPEGFVWDVSRRSPIDLGLEPNLRQEDYIRELKGRSRQRRLNFYEASYLRYLTAFLANQAKRSQ